MVQSAFVLQGLLDRTAPVEYPQMDVPGRWVDSSDEISDNVASAFCSYVDNRKSSTMELDISQPPTPDGTGLPANFGVIGPGIYRASYPQAVHFAALEPLKLKTIITLVPEEIPQENVRFMARNGIVHHHIHVHANKEGNPTTEDEVIMQILQLMIDKQNHPMLIHCNKGKHRTGCVTACFRKVTGWTLEACLDEYERYSKPKDRPLDKKFIAAFESAFLKSVAFERGFVGGAFAQPLRPSSTASQYTVNTLCSEESVDEF